MAGFGEIVVPIRVQDDRPSVVISITCSDAFGAVTARRELSAHLPLDDLRVAITETAVEAATHVADLVDQHSAITLRSIRAKERA